jgi:hypothetical protein
MAGFGADTMLRVSPEFIPWLRGPGNERTIMGNLAIVEEFAGSDELDELYRLDASETEPEDEDDEDDEDDEGDEDAQDDDADEGIQPEEMPHD